MSAIESPWPEDSFWYTDLDYPEFDPEAAAALVEEVEAETGEPIAFSILSPIDETNTNYKLALAEQLRAVGMDVDVADATDVNDYVNRYITGDYDITTAGLFAMLDPWFEYTRRYRSESPLNGTGLRQPGARRGPRRSARRRPIPTSARRPTTPCSRSSPTTSCRCSPAAPPSPSSPTTPSRAGARSSVRTASGASATRPSCCVADEFWRNDQ